MIKLGKLRRHVWAAAAVFTLQGLAAAFCAVPASAHAKPFTAMTSDCAKPMAAAAGQHEVPDGHAHACAHCDMPDEAAGYVLIVAVGGPVMSAAPLFAQWPPQHAQRLSTRILAPPGSAHLLFSTTSRLLI